MNLKSKKVIHEETCRGSDDANREWRNERAKKCRDKEKKCVKCGKTLNMREDKEQSEKHERECQGLKCKNAPLCTAKYDKYAAMNKHELTCAGSDEANKNKAKEATARHREKMRKKKKKGRRK